MKVVVIGGGPGGLFLSILLKRLDPSIDVIIHERNPAAVTFGFGVVFSDETLDHLREADPETMRLIEQEFRSWGEIEIRFGGTVHRSGGHGFSAIARTRLLKVLGDRARSLGVIVNYRSEITSLDQVDDADLVVAADGINSLIRRQLSTHFLPSLDHRHSKYAWFGTPKVFERFTFVFEETQHGLFQAHIYPYDDHTSTFIVETDPETWKAQGLDRWEAHARLPGESDLRSMAWCETLFAEHLDGHPLLANNSRWLSFDTVRNERWSAGNVVLLGDAAHTAHFSIGSGTKLAMEDAIALAEAVNSHSDVSVALKTYEEARRPEVASLQRAAQASLEWFEGVRRYRRLDPHEFGFTLLTRSQRITYDKLRLRDPEYMERLDRWFWERQPPHLRPSRPSPPMFYPFELRGLRLNNRVVVSPMAQYSALDGMPNDWHLVHLGSRAVGGAGLVMTEMTCVTADGRITPTCTGLWNTAQRDEWARIVRFVHEHTQAKIGLQLGHSGRKGSTKVMWEGVDDPLPEGNWPIMSASPLRYRPDSQLPKEMDGADLESVRDAYVRSARFGAEAGFDLLELHYAHGYLLSSFISPLTNVRTDRYGGSLRNRMRYPLEVLEAVRSVWPENSPLSVRISATDWVAGGIDGADAVEIAKMLAGSGCDIVDVSTGQTTIDAAPVYGRLYQTPFSDRIRHEAGIPTMTVGRVASIDDVNTILLAGRADLCLLARPHLVDPYWTLNAALDQGYDEHPWPVQYLSGREARRREQMAVVDRTT